MAIDYKIPAKVKIIQDALLVRHTFKFEIDRPVQAWQWMNQTRSVPDHLDWVRPEVVDAWRRCLEDYQLPLGNYTHWQAFEAIQPVDIIEQQTSNIERLIKQLSHNFTVFLQEAGAILVLTTAEGRLLTTMGEKQLSAGLVSRLYQPNINWHEAVLGNNGIGTALKLRQPIAFQGQEHFISLLHPFTTIGYPLQDDTGNLIAVIGLISNQQSCMNALFAFLHLICVLVNTNLPLAHNKNAQEQVLKHINAKSPEKSSTLSSEYAGSETLDVLLQKAVKLQAYKMPILITGESGVGKDYFVNLLRRAGPRKDAPFIAINCASIPRDLIESELFGYEAGSFTGARSNGKPGKFRLADKGILFLDEIGDMSFDLQSTLLRVLETSEFTPVGGCMPVHVDVQVVAATNVNLIEAVEAGRFRRDLYYRLNGTQIHLLPLRERPDKKKLIHHILQRELSTITNADVFEISTEVIALLESYSWPGNIRQLINVIRSTLYTANKTIITIQDLPPDFVGEMRQNQNSKAVHVAEHPAPIRLSNEEDALSLTQYELRGIKSALKECNGNLSLAAKRLGITRSTLYKKLEYFKLDRMGDALLA